MEDKVLSLPPQQLPYSRKNKAWRKKHLDWASGRTFSNYNPVRNSVLHKKINYDLILGKLHMQDLEMIINPDCLDASFIPEKIQHYPIMNSKLEVLRGEEAKRVFDYRVVVTNPNAVSEIEDSRKEQLLNSVQELLMQNSASEEEFNQKLQKISDYYSYEWQDMREIRANALLNHYVKELDVPLKFNSGFMDAMIVGEELYQCDIVGGEPTLEKINPIKLSAYKSGYSNRIEDADIIIIEDYWNPGKIIDTFYDVLTKKDISYIENLPNKIANAATDSMDNIDERYGLVNNYMIGDEITSQDGFFFDPLGNEGGYSESLMPYDMLGNIRVIKMYWKSRRRIKKVKSYDLTTGEEVYNFYTEDYVINEDLGEEEEIFYINEAWEGTKIGEDIYVNMRPRPVQYNRLGNPSRCHFGIIGSIYNLNDNKPFSLVDIMKPYNYLYDAIHDRLNKLMARSWGKIIKLDLATVPKGWEIDKWMYYARINNIAVVDSFKEGDIGAATGKLAGVLNNNTSGVIDAELGNSIQMDINYLEFLKMEMSEVAGITKQREGQISNRETVGGVERATLQSSHITEWLFVIHDNLKKRVLEALLETAKIALKGRNKKFSYILSDNSMRIMDIDGDEFSENDYGLVVDNGTGTQDLNSKLDTLAQAALQNQTLSFSTIMKLYSSSSLAEKQRLVEKDERELQERQSQMQQQQLEQQQADMQARMQVEQAKLQQENELNARDNQTKVLIAQMQVASRDGIMEPQSPEEKELLKKKIEQIDGYLNIDKDKARLEREKFEFDKKLSQKELELKRKQVNKKQSNSR